MIDSQKYDIAIVGAGIVGLTFACCFKNSRLRLAVVDKTFEPKAVQARVSAITAVSQQSLERLGAWSRIEAVHQGRFCSMRIFDHIANAPIQFNDNSLGQPHLGTIVANHILQHALIQQARSCSNIDFIAPVQCVAFHRINAMYHQLQFLDHSAIDTQLLIGADGAHSFVRRHAGIQETYLQYPQSSLITTVTASRPHRMIAHQFFLKTGPLAFLPLYESNCYALVWSTLPQQALVLQTLSVAEFCKMLTETTKGCLGQITQADACSVVPTIAMRHSYCYVQDHLALLGDAAHTMHPLAGQGANLGIADALCLADVIQTAEKKQRSIAALYTLQRYERQRRLTNASMLRAVDFLYQLFTSERTILQKTRGFCLNFLDRNTFLKKCLSYYAGGVV